MKVVYEYRGKRYHRLSMVEDVMGRKLSRRERGQIVRGEHGEVKRHGMGDIYSSVVRYRVNPVVFRKWEGVVVGLCPARGRKEDYLVPCYDGKCWRWVEYHHVVRNSSGAEADEVILRGCEQVYGRSGVRVRCVPVYC